MNEVNLYKRFNEREVSAFSELYSLVYDEIYGFTAKIYKGTEIDANDVIHDLFLYLWKSSICFENLISFKSYLYTAIRNKQKNYIVHQKYVDDYAKEQVKNDAHYDMAVVESEFHVLLSEMMESLPDNYREVLRLHIEGWDVKSIAEKLDITQKSVYNRKVKAVDMLKKRIGSNKTYMIISIIAGL